VDYRTLRPAKKNARYMSEAMMARLTENIAKDGALSQLPLCWKSGESFEILSGHHRVAAAVKAGVIFGLTLYTDQDLSDAEKTAIQLSHNAIAGDDNLQVLMEMVATIQDPKVLRYAAVDLASLPKPNAKALLGLTEARLVLHPVIFYLTAPEIQTFEQFAEEFNERPVPEGEKGFVVDLSVYEAFMQELGRLAQRHGIKSANAALCHAIELMHVEAAEQSGEEVGQ
jgi:hypothetical protein